MKIMVTGGAGFIGSNVVDGYIEAGHDVCVVDDLSSGKRDNVNPSARFYEVDIRSPRIREIMAQERPEVLNHHAAQISVPASVQDPLLDADINLRGFLNLLESAVTVGVGKAIFISSGGAIYGEAEEYPTTEGYAPKPLSPYAVAKYASEHYLAFYAHQYGLRYTTLRYANIYGPRQIPHGEAGVVAIFMDNLIQGRPSKLYHFPEEERGMTRDYCFVGDVVRANLLALDAGDGEFFNIGTGVETKTLDLYEMIYETYCALEAQVPANLASPQKEPARPGDLKKSCLVTEKAARVLGWQPQVSLKEGVLQTFRWRLGRDS